MRALLPIRRHALAKGDDRARSPARAPTSTIRESTALVSPPCRVASSTQAISSVHPRCLATRASRVSTVSLIPCHLPYRSQRSTNRRDIGPRRASRMGIWARSANWSSASVSIGAINNAGTRVHGIQACLYRYRSLAIWRWCSGMRVARGWAWVCEREWGFCEEYGYGDTGM